MASVVKSFSISGINGYPVVIETDTLYGQPSVSIIGLGDKAVREASERLEAALLHYKYEFPKMKIVINLAPCDIKKSGSHFDLGMAIGLLIQSGQVIAENVDMFAFVGELSLNGILRPCSGVLPMVLSAKLSGVTNVIVPAENVREGSLVNGVNIFGFDNLKQVIDFLQGSNQVIPYAAIESRISSEVVYNADFNEVKGQDVTIEFITIACAGGHNVLLLGAPGCGKSMIAKRIPTILPNMTEEESPDVMTKYNKYILTIMGINGVLYLCIAKKYL